MKKVLTSRVGLVIAFALILAALATAGASAVTVTEGNLKIKVEGATSPSALPKKALAPISFHGSATISTADGTHIPPAESTEILVDRHIAIDTTGLPTCTLGQIEASAPAAAMAACGDALIGKGTSTAQVAFPEQASFEAKGPLLAFNGPAEGGYGGYHEQLYYVYADVPVPTALIAVAKVAKATGPYGYKITVSIPKIAGGAGSFEGADFTIDRKWTYKGAEHSFLSAECPDGRFAAQVKVDFGDGYRVTGNVIQPCRAEG
ncbi:MAG TPA: hypothetical protein VHZ54_19815 [Solirubrobacterales bacterium]|jgi:hypothetical protein|nr:hypothetical protein [Solirubrobacterales bacterium]